MSHRIVLGAFALAAVLIGLILAPSAHAQDEAFTLELQVEGTDVRVIISDIDTPVGALDLLLVGLEPLATECVLPSGFGLCSEDDGVVRLVAINATGWTETSELMAVTTVAPPPDAVTLEISRGTDLAGVDLVGAIRDRSESGSSDGGLGWPIGLVIATIVGVGAGLWTITTAVRRRAPRSVADPGD